MCEKRFRVAVVSLIWSLLLVIWHSLAFGQYQTIIRRIDQSHGLSYGTVTCFAQDHDGFMWVGTKDGLNVYDGSDFSVLNTTNSLLRSSDISDIIFDKTDKLWIGTFGGGLYLYDPLSESLESVELQTASDRSMNITRVLSDHQGWIWVGTDNALYLLKQSGTQPHEAILIRGSINVKSITQVDHNKILVGTWGDGIIEILRESLEQRVVSSTFNHVNTIISEASGTVLIGTHGSGLWRYDLRSNQAEDLLKKLEISDQIEIVRVLFRDSRGAIWVGTDGHGIIRISGEEYQRYSYSNQTRYSISTNGIQSIFEDKDSNLWIGTIWKGINVIERSSGNVRFIYGDFAGSDPYPVLSVYSENEGLWIGTDGNGLFLNQGGTIEHLHSNSSPGLSGDYIQEIYKDVDGIYWIGTFANGLNRFDPLNNTIDSYMASERDQNSISHNDVREIVEVNEDGLWIITWGGGLNYFNKRNISFTRYGFDHADKFYRNSDNLTSMVHDRERTGLWLGSFGSGIFFFDLKKREYTPLNLENSGNSELMDNVMTLHLAKNGTLWAGTWEHGIVNINPDTKSRLVRNSLEQIGHARIMSIEEDSRERIWFSTKNGLFQYVPDSDRLVNMGGMNLLTNKEFHISSSAIGPRGQMYFGGIEGLIVIDADNYEISNKTSSVVINGFKLFNRKVEVGDQEILKKTIRNTRHVELNYDDDVITFEFSAVELPFSNASYAIKMENFDRDWREIGQFKTATYTSLPPGDYIFKVRSRLEQADWGEPASIEITILKPIWLSWYAYLLYIFIFSTLLFLFYKYSSLWASMKANLRLEKITRERERELHNVKQRFFTNISHEIRTPVTLILGAINRMVENSASGKAGARALDVIRKNGHHLLHLVEELLDFRKLEAEGIQLAIARNDFVEFCKELHLSFTSTSETKNIQYSFESEVEELPMWFDSEQMEKVVYNLLNNAFKYTEGNGSIKVKISYNDDEAFLSVTNTCKPFSKDELTNIFDRFYQCDKLHSTETGFGLGLSIASDIVKEHLGDISVDYDNRSSEITFTVKLLRGKGHFDEGLLISPNLETDKVENTFLSDDSGHGDSTNGFPELTDSTLLIVEDNEQLREYLSNLFEGAMEVIVAANGEEGWEMITQYQPDIVLSDVMMPLMDGITLTRKIKSDKRTSHIIVALLTARTSLIHKKEGYEIGADEYINKPFNEVLLKTRIANLIRNRRQIGEKLMAEFLARPKENLQLNTPDQQFLHDLTELIEKNLVENELTAEFISKTMGMSHSVVYKKVKSLTGLSLVEFIRDFKLNRAAQLLVKYQFSVTDTCFKVGFSDRRYFSQVFKKKFGKSPSEYVNSMFVNEIG